MLEHREGSCDKIIWTDFHCYQYLALENVCFSQNTRLKEIICCYYCLSCPLSTSLLNKEKTALLRVKNQMAADLEKLLNHREVIFLFLHYYHKYVFFLSLALNRGRGAEIGLLWFDLLGVLLSFSETQVKVLVRYSGGSQLYSKVAKFSLMTWSHWNRRAWQSVKHLQAFNKHLDKGDELDTHVICKACMCPR